jgi:hypothetical protein
MTGGGPVTQRCSTECARQMGEEGRRKVLFYIKISFVLHELREVLRKRVDQRLHGGWALVRQRAA